MGKEAEADARAREIEERQVHIRQPLVADHQATEPIEPGKSALDYPAIPPERLAGLDPAASNATRNAAAAQVGPTAREVVALLTNGQFMPSVRSWWRETSVGRMRPGRSP